jgi:hypothetical protein
MRSYQIIGVTVHFLVLLITLRAPPSMDTVGEQSQSLTLTDAQRPKIESNKTRLRRGIVQRKMIHAL